MTHQSLNNKEFIDWLAGYYEITVNYTTYNLFHMSHYDGSEVRYEDHRDKNNIMYQKLTVYYDEIEVLVKKHKDYLIEKQRKIQNDVDFSTQVNELIK